MQREKRRAAGEGRYRWVENASRCSIMAENCRTFVLPREWGKRREVIGPITVQEQICRMTDFAAIDFETANEYSSSVCSVGLVVVRDGVVTDRFYSLIHPEPEYFSWFCQQVHGLTEEDCADAPIFPEVWKQIAPRIARQPSLFDASGLGEDFAPRFYDEIPALPLVAHNSPFDERCLRAVFRTYGMDYPDYRFHDTLRASRRHFGTRLENHQLQTVAAACGYDLLRHHHALADAEACAVIALKLL